MGENYSNVKLIMTSKIEATSRASIICMYNAQTHHSLLVLSIQLLFIACFKYRTSFIACITYKTIINCLF